MSEAATNKQRIGELTRAFKLFSQEMGKLERSYASLQQQFQEVNHQLEESNRQLKGKVEELDTTTTYLREILDNMTQGVIYVDGTGKITTFNPGAESILRLSADDILDSYYWDHFEDDQFGFSIRYQLSEQHECDWEPISFMTQDGRERYLEISAAPANGGLIILVRDRTEMRDLQLLAARNDRLKELGEMAAAVAHEIRNPLGGIKGFAALLARDLKEQPHQAGMAQAIVEGASTLDRLVSDVLYYARPLRPQLEPVELSSLLHEVADLVHADEKLSRNLDFVLAIQEESVVASLDRKMLKGALLNLIVNGIHAMAKGGQLRLRLELCGEWACIEVSDTGCGIPEEQLEKIFSPFFTTKTKGNGLGLPEVYKVVQAHGGSIHVVSQQDEGTTFTLKLRAHYEH